MSIDYKNTQELDIWTCHVGEIPNWKETVWVDTPCIICTCNDSIASLQFDEIFIPGKGFLFFPLSIFPQKFREIKANCLTLFTVFTIYFQVRVKFHNFHILLVNTVWKNVFFQKFHESTVRLLHFFRVTKFKIDSLVSHSKWIKNSTIRIIKFSIWVHCFCSLIFTPDIQLRSEVELSSHCHLHLFANSLFMKKVEKSLQKPPLL